MAGRQVLQQIFLKHKYQLLLANLLFGLEMLGLLLRPYFLGEAVNDLIQHSYRGLLWLAGAQLLWLSVGTVRHMYDTRTYSAIYTSLVTGMLRRVREAAVSRMSAHSSLAREFVDFLEYDTNYVIEALYNLVGSLILLFFYEKRVVLLCGVMLIPVLFMSYVYGRRMKWLNKLKNDELERQVDVIGTRDPATIRTHYEGLRSWQVRISDQEAWNFGAMELLVLVVITASLLIAVRDGSTTIMAGDIIAMYSYILNFVSGLDTIPYAVQRVASLRDIMQRVELEAEELEAKAK
jgi:ABC-type multidrug transport system fused ATPase/permease subunit